MLWGALKAFVRGPVGSLAGAVSALMTVIAVAQGIEGESVWMWLFFAALALVALAFWRFYELHRDRRKEDVLLQGLGRRLMLGRMVALVPPRSLFDTDEAFEEALEREREAAKEWAKQTRDLIRDRIGWDQAALFESDHGLPERYDGPSGYLHTGEEIERFLARRCLRLEQLIQELRRGMYGWGASLSRRDVRAGQRIRPGNRR